MRCPHCNEEIDSVIVNSTCFQVGMLEEQDGLVVISHYSDDITVDDTTSMQCPECMETITGIVEFWELLSSQEMQVKLKEQTMAWMQDQTDEPY